MSEQPTGNDVAGALTRLEEQVTRAARARCGGSASPSAAPARRPSRCCRRAPGSYAWVGALDAPVRRRPQVPRLLLEGLFLAAAAAAAAIADLDAVAIGGVMVGAWVLVALIEWAASRADRRRSCPSTRPPASAAAGRGSGVVQPAGRAHASRRRVGRQRHRGHPPPARRRRVEVDGRARPSSLRDRGLSGPTVAATKWPPSGVAPPRGDPSGGSAPAGPACEQDIAFRDACSSRPPRSRSSS